MKRKVEFHITAPEENVMIDEFTEEVEFDSIGDLFRRLSKEFGRCISKVYLEEPNDEVRETGWVFQKRKKYDDCDDTYLQDTWCTVIREEIPMRRVVYSLAELESELSKEASDE